MQRSNWTLGNASYEITHAFEQLAPEDVLKQKQAEQAQRQANELQEFKEAMDREQNDQIERIKAEKKFGRFAQERKSYVLWRLNIIK